LPVNDLVFQDGTVVADHITLNTSLVIFRGGYSSSRSHKTSRRWASTRRPDPGSVLHLLPAYKGPSHWWSGWSWWTWSTLLLVRWWPERPEGLAAQVALAGSIMHVTHQSGKDRGISSV